MKALSLASILAIGLAGAACSDTPEPKEDVKVETPEVTETAAPEDDGFNFMIPGGDVDVETADDGFNLSIPDDGPSISSGEFNLPADIPTSNGLDDLPEIEAPIIETPEPEAHEDALIRIE